MSNKVKVSNVVIEIGGKKIDLSLAEAKELQEILNDTFPEKETVYVSSPAIIYDRPWPYYRWNPPTWICGGQSYTAQAGMLNLPQSGSTTLCLSAKT